MDKHFIEYHTGMLIDTLFRESSTYSYRLSDQDIKIKILSQAMQDYIGHNALSSEEVAMTTEATHTFLKELFEGEERAKQ